MSGKSTMFGLVAGVYFQLMESNNSFRQIWICRSEPTDYKKGTLKDNLVYGSKEYDHKYWKICW